MNIVTLIDLFKWKKSVQATEAVFKADADMGMNLQSGLSPAARDEQVSKLTNHSGHRLRTLPARLRRPIGINIHVHTLDSLRYRDYRFLWTLTVGLAAYDWTLSVVMGWMTFDLTRSPFLTSLALAMSALPFLLFSPFAGVLADDWDRRKILALAIGVKAVITAVFAVIVLMGYLDTWHIFVFLFLGGTTMVLIHPASLSLLSNVVPKEHLVNAYALNSLGFNVIRLSVPALAGLSITIIGPGETLLLGVVTLIGSMLAALAIRMDSLEGRQTEHPHPFAQITEAFLYVKDEKVVLSLVLLGMVPALLLLPFVHGLMPVYAGEVFNVGPVGLGMLVSAPGIGSIVGMILIATVRTMPSGRVIVLSLAWATMWAATFSTSGSISAALPILTLLSGGLATFYTVNGATVQQIIPNALRGRVASLGAMAHGVYPVGALAAGALAQSLGAPTATLIAAVVMIALVSTSFVAVKRVWDHR